MSKQPGIVRPCYLHCRFGGNNRCCCSRIKPFHLNTRIIVRYLSCIFADLFYCIAIIIIEKASSKKVKCCSCGVWIAMREFENAVTSNVRNQVFRLCELLDSLPDIHLIEIILWWCCLPTWNRPGRSDRIGDINIGNSGFSSNPERGGILKERSENKIC